MIRILTLALLLGSAGSVVAADAEAGRKVFRKCMACHSVDADGPRKSGPTLHGVIGRQVGAVEGFSYSPAMAEDGGVWDEARLSEFLENPRQAMQGTRMMFVGLRSDEERADVIAYLRAVME